jgi:F-type H+-transporting ATPase subunit gamma
MANTRLLKTRIRSVRSMRQITKAMELVAASRLRRAQEASNASRLYAETARELLTQLADLTDVKRDKFYAARPVKKRLIIAITSDRGLAGAYNSNIHKLLTATIKEDQRKKIETLVICVGRKGAQFLSHVRDTKVIGVYHTLPEHLGANNVRPILNSAVEEFLTGDVDAVDIISTRFVSSMKQTAERFQLLPAGFDDTNEVSKDIALASFEPSVEEVLDGATIRLLEAQLFQAMLDANASEQSMRRVAMKNATDNAGDIIDDLTLEMNKVRQGAITQELSEISGGVEAMK